MFKQMLEARMSPVARRLKRVAVNIEMEAKRTVAVDTGKLEDSIYSGNVVRRKNLFSVDVGSKAKHAFGVEFGFGKVVQWHRRKGVSRPIVFVGNGMLYLNRGIEKFKSQLLTLFKK